MSKPYSGIPLDEKRTWVVPRWLKEAFVAFAIVAVLAVGISKGVQHFGAVSDRARSAVQTRYLSSSTFVNVFPPSVDMRSPRAFERR